MADTPLLDVETLGPTSAYPHLQLARACLIASQCAKTFTAIRFVYALPPEKPREQP